MTLRLLAQAVAVILIYQALPYPLITDLSTNPNFRFVQESVQAYYRSELGSAPPPPLALFSYIPDAEQDLLSLASRFSLPPETIATANGLENQHSPLPEMLILPNQPGIFVPDRSENDLERTLSDRLADHGVPVSLNRAGRIVSGRFYPGQRLSGPERLLFVQRYFGEPLRSFRVSAYFGLGQDPFSRQMRYHQGVDLVPLGGIQEVIAAASGQVTKTGEDRVYGKFVIVSHDGGFSTLYAHLSSIGRQVGDRIRIGGSLGTVGTTGLSTGPHLHFEIRRDGASIDPGQYVPALRKR